MFARGRLVAAAAVVAALPVVFGWPAPLVGAIIAAAPLLLWFMWAPAGRTATIVGWGLFAWFVVGWAMLVIADTMLTPVASIDVLVIYGPVALVGMLTGTGFLAAARRRTAIAGQGTNTNTKTGAGTIVRALITAVLLVPCGMSAVAPLLGFVSVDTAGEPTPEDMPPLPMGARIVSANSHCGSTGEFCTGEFVVESNPGGRDDLATAVAAHWTRLGWSALAPCRFQGLIHRIERCWFVAAINGHTIRVIVQHAIPRQGRTTPATIPG